MKETYTALGLVVLGLVGLLFLDLFGDITVTNQQDYTSMKNSIEAALYDSIDQDAFENGFCLCTNVGKTNGVYKFKDKNEYKIINLVNKETNCNKINGYAYCKYLIGETKIDKEVFLDCFIKRFSNKITRSKDYRIEVKDIIEYPPRVSILISGKNYSNILNLDMKKDSYEIVNKVDSILENNK